MSKYIWRYLKKQAWSKDREQKIFLVCSVLAFCIVGAVLWGLVGRWFLPEISWMLCFIGYSGFFGGFVGGLLYLWRHDT